MCFKATTVLLILGLVMCLGSPQAQGNTYTYSSTPYYLSLSHDKYYAWGIEWAGLDLGIPEGEIIEEATFKISNINDLSADFNVLHIWLVDELPDVRWTSVNWPGVSVGKDRRRDYSDAFAGSGGVHLMDYTDSYWWRPENLEVELPVNTLQDYISNDGMFGLALDPDCYYYQQGLSLIITTCPVPPQPNSAIPEPMTGLGVFMGVGALGGYLRRRGKLF